VEPVTYLLRGAPVPNPIEMERVIRKAGYLYCGADFWRHPVDDDPRRMPYDRVELVEAFRRVTA
jgi:hypothetical protein